MRRRLFDRPKRQGTGRCGATGKRCFRCHGLKRVTIYLLHSPLLLCDPHIARKVNKFATLWTSQLIFGTAVQYEATKIYIAVGTEIPATPANSSDAEINGYQKGG